ncbi:MAG: XrtA system polysaccharide deacetylase [Pseudomonadota bacterium]
MSCDVEDYFQVSAFEHLISRDDWPVRPSRVERNVDKLLALYDEADARCTFFTLGWVAERLPRVVRKIVDQGHEIASHGYDHKRVTSLTPEQFRDDVVRTKALLEQISGVEVRGYRAPSFSIGLEAEWAHPILEEAGYAYSSSVYPVSHDHYGLPSAPRVPFRINDCGLLEVPMSTVRFGGRNFPVSGGGYFRLLPLRLSKAAIRRINQHEHRPAVFYFHPWEIDPEQPRVPGISVKTRFRHYLNLSRFESRLRDLLESFRWDRMDHVFLGGS